MDVHPQLDFADQIIRLLGWPTLLGGLVWAVRKWDKSAEAFKSIYDSTSETRRMMLETLGGVNEIKENHLAHLAAEVKAQTPILLNMDKTLAVIAAKIDRP